MKQQFCPLCVAVAGLLSAADGSKTRCQTTNESAILLLDRKDGPVHKSRIMTMFLALGGSRG
jgi:hypothetical protein